MDQMLYTYHMYNRAWEDRKRNGINNTQTWVLCIVKRYCINIYKRPCMRLCALLIKEYRQQTSKYELNRQFKKKNKKNNDFR